MNRKRIIKSLGLFLSLVLLLGTTDIVLAVRSTISMGGIAGNIHGSASILARVMWAACVIVGIALFITAFTQFQTHRRNPKLVPLTTPAMYLLLALVALAIPFAEHIFNFEDAYENEDQTNNSYVDIDR